MPGKVKGVNHLTFSCCKNKGSSIAATGKLSLQTGCLCLLLGHLAAASLTLLKQMPLIVQGCCVTDGFTGCGEGGVEERGEGQKQQSANRTLQASAAGSSPWFFF